MNTIHSPNIDQILKEITDLLFNNCDNILLLLNSTYLNDNEKNYMQSLLYNYLKIKIQKLSDQEFNDYIVTVHDFFPEFINIEHSNRLNKGLNLLNFLKNHNIFLVCFDILFVFIQDDMNILINIIFNHLNQLIMKFDLTLLKEISEKIQHNNMIRNKISKEITDTLFQNNDNILLLMNSTYLRYCTKNKIKNLLYNFFKDKINNSSNQELNKYTEFICDSFPQYTSFFRYTKRNNKEINFLNFIKDKGILSICFDIFLNFIQNDIDMLKKILINEIMQDLMKFNTRTLKEILKIQKSK